MEAEKFKVKELLEELINLTRQKKLKWKLVEEGYTKGSVESDEYVVEIYNRYELKRGYFLI